MKYLNVCASAVVLFGLFVLSGCGDRGELTPIEPSEDQAKKQPEQPRVESAEESADEKSLPPAIAPFDAVQAKAYQKAWARHLDVPAATTNSIRMKLALIPAGEFIMGSTEEERARLLEEAKARKEILVPDVVRREGPEHRVRITKPFYLGLYEVTQAEYEEVMGENPSVIKGARNPVGQVSWVEAMEFCKRLSVKEGEAYRLPTEAEWEYACRAGTTTQYSCGDDPASLGEYGSYADGPNRRMHPAGEKKPNPWGLYDMHGNVKEWCADGAEMGYYLVSPTDDPPGPETDSHRVYRGGGWLSRLSHCRSAYRDGDAPDLRDPDLGFRLARSLSGK